MRLIFFSKVTVGPYWKLLSYVVSIWTNGRPNDRQKLAQTFREHYSYVRAVVPKEKLLELEPGSGYEAICKFLDKPIPKNEIYPHINPPDNIIKGHTRLWWYTVAVTGMKVGRNVGALAIAAGAIWYFSSGT